MAVFEREAQRTGAPLFAFGSAWNAWAENGRLIYQDEGGLCDLAAPRLAGAHQVMNGALAVAAIRAAGLALDDEVLSAGLQNARWPARLQRLKSGPLVEAVGRQSELWLDGGHNPHAARALASAFADFEERNSRPLILIAGMQENKDIDGFFAAFSGLASTVFAVQANHSGARTPDDIAAAGERAGIPAYSCASLQEAATLARGGGPARVLICGSLYLAGEVLRDNA
jgi:dihydrofolate synthase/folylpolyglutamate synthase